MPVMYLRDQYGRRKVAGRGPVPAEVMLVGEAPGKEEDKTGKPFIGKTGKELERLCREAGLVLPKLFLTNVVKYRPLTNKATGNSAPTIADIARDEHELVAEISSVQPKWIAAVGRIAARWFFEQDVDMEDVEGFAFPGLPRAQGAIVVPVRHPAAGFHQPEAQPFIHRDFLRLGEFIRGEIPPIPPVDEYPNPDYFHVTKPLKLVRNQRIAVDTEGVSGSAWCLTYSMQPGTGGLVLGSDRRTTKWARKLLLQNKVVVHNAPHDLRILAELFNMPLVDLLYQLDFDDSMQAAYVLRLLPKGLKSLGRRYKGVQMQSYKSVVADADRQIMLDYFKQVLKVRCSWCGGLGEVLMQPTSEKTGKLLAERPVKCGSCGGDGTGWAPPTEKLVVKGDKISVSSGRRMGWRVRSIMADSEKIDPESGERVDLRKRYEDMRKKSYEFVLQVEDRLGPPRAVTLDDVPFDTAKHYACRDADVTMRVWPDIERELDKEGLRRVYEMDRAVIPMVTQMMDVGWKIDTGFLRTYSNKLEIQQDKILHRLERLVGRSINPNSSQQVGDLLFNQYGLHPVKLTNTGADSTDNKVLADLQIHCNTKADTSPKHRQAYDAITYMLDWKERSKLRSTYTLALPRLVDENDRLHTTLKLATVESGRLASADPNLQNIPARTDLGKAIRKAFICGEGNVLLSCDYSQVEMRVLAHESNEKRLIKAIREGMSVHKLTCQKIFGVPMDQVTKDMWQYDAAKTLGFGIVYGISAPALKVQIKLQSAKHQTGGIDIPVEQCEGWIEDYTTRTYPAIGDYMLDSQAEARRYGYVEDMFGRRRYLPGVKSPIGSVRSEAERIATNHKIQAGAQGVIKLAMAELWYTVLPKFRRRGFCEAIMQIHDELVFEVRRELAEELKSAVERVMVGVMKLKVPLAADGKLGMNWRELKG